MATTAKKKPVRKQAPAPSTDDADRRFTRRRQIRLAVGSLLILAGIFICLSITSYFFTWKTDQDALVGNGSLPAFLKSKQAVANWGGRLGAALGHYLVFRGAGLASLAIGLYTTIVGLHIVYKRRAAPLMRYLRWLCLIVLVLAPILAYVFPNAAFPFGGALGNEAVTYSNGFIGHGGTGLLLTGAAAFVLFVIFALDITPLIRRARMRAARLRESMQNFGKGDEDFLSENNGVPVIVADKTSAESIILPEDYVDESTEITPLTGIDTAVKTKGKSYNMKVQEKPVIAGATAMQSASPAGVEDEEELSEEEKEFAAYQAQREAELHKATAQVASTPQPEEAPEYSFEVVPQQEEKIAPAATHGAHITVESGEPYAPELDLPSYKFPTLDLLDDRSHETVSIDKEELEKAKNQIIQTLKSFSIEIQSIKATVGPTVTLFEIVPSEGVRISKIRNLEDDIALNLAALGIRIIAPIPGRGTIGIEVPNANKQIVGMRSLLQSEKFANSKMSLPIALGKKIDNENYIVDLATMPHLLMAGATGQGKSVGINAILVSLLYKKHPSQLKFVMVDPKKVELSVYRLIEKHFLAKLPNEEDAIITDTKKVINTLNALCIEMDTRYELLKEAGARNIKEYNEKFIARRLNPEKGHKFLPFIVLVIDEFADLIMTAGKEVEMPIARIAQLARAVGIHLIVATQRPSVNVITGTIKANFPARIAFKVSAKVDSRTILDAGGAEQLIGRGDMLVSHGSELLRLQCAFVDTHEVEKIVDFIGTQRGYPHAFELPEYDADNEEPSGKKMDITNRDELFNECAQIVVSTQSGSTSNLQRKLNLGYNRAGRIMDQLEAAGIVGPAKGSKPREVQIKTEYELEHFLDTLS